MIEFQRELSDKLGIKSKIVFLNPSRSCDEKQHDLPKKLLTYAFFNTTTACRGKNSDYKSDKNIIPTIKAGVTYAEKNAYLVLVLHDTKGLQRKVYVDLRNVIKVARELKLRPVVITSTPKDFMKDVKLSFRDLILINETYHDHEGYRNALYTIKNSLLPYRNYDLSIKDLNGLLGNLGYMPKHNTRDMLYMQKKQSSNIVALIDALAIMILMYMLYKTCQPGIKQSSKRQARNAIQNIL